MPKTVENYELASHSRSTSIHSPSLNSPDKFQLSPSPRSSLDSLGEYDPLKSEQAYQDDDSSPLHHIFSTRAYTARRRTGWQRWLVPSRTCCCMIALFVVTLVLLISTGGFWFIRVAGVPEYGQSDPWYPSPRGGTLDSWQESYKKAAELVGKMTLVEKVNITTGTGWEMGMCVGNTGPVERLGFPALCLQDGPLGLRFTDRITAFPAGITVGATWNKDLMYQRGRAHAIEARLKGVNVLLGPSMGPLGRLPAGGRNWEGFGADPVLQGIAAAQTIKGIQDEGVMATAKHYVGNEQEHYRQSWEWGTPNAISSNIDDRTLHEIYAWPFADSIRAGVASVMCSYNQLNNSYTCQNSKLLNGILKDEMGFQGFVQSDWLAQRSGVASALAGLDMSMPGDGLIWQDGKSLWGGELTKAVLNGSVPMERVNDMVLRIVAAWYQVGQDDQDNWPVGKDGGPNFSSWTWDKIGKLHPGSDDETVGHVNKFVEAQGNHGETARAVAAEGIVLVKNEKDMLPFVRNGFEMLRSDKRKLKIGIFGEDAFSNPKGANACADRACNVGTLAQGWGSGAVEFPFLTSPADALHQSFDNDTVDLSDFPSNDLDMAAGAANQDLCMVFINSDAGEGFVAWEDVKGDRNNLYPQKGGDDLVRKVAKTCGGGKAPLVVVVHSVGPVILEKWIDLSNVKAVLLAHLPGQESGDSLMDVLFGEVNPSGRLPYTIAKREKDYGPDSKIMYKANAVVPQQNFTEGLQIDYRYFDTHKITPRYEFGYGLSYTTFRLSFLTINALIIGPREPYPKPRPNPLDAPLLDRRIPPISKSLFPSPFRKLHKYVYPYITSASDIRQGRYPYPDGYEIIQPPSPAGGDQGGNPDLYTTLVVVQALLSNTGDVPGATVVQLYVTFPADMRNSINQTVDMPPRVLRGFDKVFVGVDEEAKVSIELTRRDLSFWDVGVQNWVLPTKGTFSVGLGFSSRDFPEGTVADIPFE